MRLLDLDFSQGWIGGDPSLHVTRGGDDARIHRHGRSLHVPGVITEEVKFQVVISQQCSNPVEVVAAGA